MEDENCIHLQKTINSIDWLPLEKQPGDNRTLEEYYGNENGNVVVGCANGGVYIYHVNNK